MKHVFVLFLLCFTFTTLYSQSADESYQLNTSFLIDSQQTVPPVAQKRSFFELAWRPAALALISVDLLRDSTKYGLQTMARSFVADTFRTHVDDWIHYAPVVTMYAADLLRVPARNTVWNQTKFLIFSEVITSGIVLGLKYGLKIQRPNNGAFNAYPSGHTSQAFVQSQVLYNEFRDTRPLLAMSGYLFSATTGALRVLNNRHWVPDVLLGAGIGIFVTNAVYYFEPLKKWNPFKNRQKRNNQLQLTVIPRIGSEYVGGFLRLRF